MQRHAGRHQDIRGTACLAECGERHRHRLNTIDPTKPHSTHTVQHNPVAFLSLQPGTHVYQVLPTEITDQGTRLTCDDRDMRNVCQRHALDHAIEVLVRVRHNRPAAGEEFAQCGATMLTAAAPTQDGRRIDDARARDRRIRPQESLDATCGGR